MSGLPFLKFDIDFEYIGGNIRIIASDPDTSERFSFTRNSQRWRYVSGPFVGIHTIASKIFEYGENPTKQEMEFMGDYVSTIGVMIDNAIVAIEKGIEEALRYRDEVLKRRIESTQFAVNEQAYQEPNTYIYLMRHKNGLTKIGRSNNPVTRERTLQAEDPRLEMIFHCQANGTVERRLHNIFESVRVRGEWFDLSSQHVDWIMLILEGIRKLESDGEQ